MPRIEGPTRWVVYHAHGNNKTGGMNGVCPQEDWTAMNEGRPGFYTLIRDGIATESEAEQLARSLSANQSQQPVRESSSGDR
jgi:hypothetical protein